MVRSRFILPQNKLSLFLIASVVVHIALFAATRTISFDTATAADKDVQNKSVVKIELVEQHQASSATEEAVRERSSEAEAAEKTIVPSQAPAAPSPEPIPVPAENSSNDRTVDASTEKPAEPTENSVQDQSRDMPTEQEIKTVQTPPVTEPAEPVKEQELDKNETEKPHPIIAGQIQTLSASTSEDVEKEPSPVSKPDAASVNEADVSDRRRTEKSVSTVKDEPSTVPFESLAKSSVTPKPAYPEIARRWGHQGVAVLEIYIKPGGLVEEVVLLQSSGYRILDEAAIDIVRKKWKFPSVERTVTTVKEFEFTLQ
jgi:protein TonB